MTDFSSLCEASYQYQVLNSARVQLLYKVPVSGGTTVTLSGVYRVNTDNNDSGNLNRIYMNKSKWIHEKNTNL